MRVNIIFEIRTEKLDIRNQGSNNNFLVKNVFFPFKLKTFDFSGR
jgi:hypothetical protein